MYGGLVIANPADLPHHYQPDEGTHRNRVKRDGDVFLLVKEYISSTELRQNPLLAMTAESAASYPLTTNSNLAFEVFCHRTKFHLEMKHVQEWPHHSSPFFQKRGSHNMFSYCVVDRAVGSAPAFNNIRQGHLAHNCFFSGQGPLPPKNQLTELKRKIKQPTC